MNTFRHSLAACAALAALTLTGCKPSTNALRHFYEGEYTVAINDGQHSFAAEVQELITHYERTGEVNHVSPHYGLTMLHLAALAQHAGMVERLLQEGADPRALSAPLRPSTESALSPIGAALFHERSGNPAAPTSDALLIVKMLLAAGADIRQEGCLNPLRLCTTYGNYHGTEDCMGGEELALKLMELGATGAQAEAASFIRCGWPKALRQLLASLPADEAASLRQDTELLRLCAEFYFRFDGTPPRKFYSGAERARYASRGMRFEKECDAAALDCAQVLLEGTSAAGQPRHGMHQLFAELVQRAWGGEEEPKALKNAYGLADLLALMIQHGADATRRAEAGAPSAADILANDYFIRSHLAEQGITLPGSGAPETPHSTHQ